MFCSSLCYVTQDASLADCQFDSKTCNASCTGYMASPIAPDEYYSMAQCLAGLTPSQWQCSSDPNDGWMFGAIPVPNGPCESLVCNWTCTDATFADLSAFVRCGC